MKDFRKFGLAGENGEFIGRRWGAAADDSGGTAEERVFAGDVDAFFVDCDEPVKAHGDLLGSMDEEEGGWVTCEGFEIGGGGGDGATDGAFIGGLAEIGVHPSGDGHGPGVVLVVLGVDVGVPLFVAGLASDGEAGGDEGLAGVALLVHLVQPCGGGGRVDWLEWFGGVEVFGAVSIR